MPWSKKLTANFDAEVFSSSVINDFKLLKASKNIIMSVSTFSWVGQLAF